MGGAGGGVMVENLARGTMSLEIAIFISFPLPSPNPGCTYLLISKSLILDNGKGIGGALTFGLGGIRPGTGGGAKFGLGGGAL